MSTPMHGSRSVAALGLVAALAPACSDPELDPCDHRVCRIEDRACVEQVARTMACRLELEELTIPQSDWSLEVGPHFITFVDDDLLLVATSGTDPASVVAEIEGWQTVEAVSDDGISMARLRPQGAPFGPCQHARRGLD